MKTHSFYTLIFALFFFSNLSAQVTFESFSSLDALLEKAKNKSKLVFIQINSQTCNQCNEVAQKGLSGAILKSKFDVNFISTQTMQGSELHQQIIEKTNTRDMGMGSLFLDSDGYLLLKYPKTTTVSQDYLGIADDAIRYSKNNVLKTLETQYKQGNRDKALLKELIQEKSKVNADTYLYVEKYVELLTISELSSIENAKLIIEQGLPLNSKARRLLYASLPPKTIDSIFYAHSLDERVKINNKIIASTRQNAVRYKDKDLGMALGNFITGTYNDNWEQGRFARQSFLVNFYKDIKDSVAFLREAKAFANYQLMEMPVDTLVKREKKVRDDLFQQQKKKQVGSGVVSFRYTPYNIKYANELNNLAYSVLLFTKDSEKLEDALKWAKRAIEINEALVPDETRKQNPMVMDTYASLLYRLGNKEEAIELETKAVEILKKRGDNANNLEITLNKMKKGEF
jgi:tetratricopeptide (TPR) repeat protein